MVDFASFSTRHNEMKEEISRMQDNTKWHILTVAAYFII